MSATLPQEPLAADSAKPAPKIHWAFLDGLRGIAALYVVLHHFVAWGYVGHSHFIHRITSVLSFGHSAVNIFIVLSGFSLMLPVARSADGALRGGWKEYLRRRALRILPPYWAALALAIAIDLCIRPFGKSALDGTIIPEREYNIKFIIEHALLIHNVLPEGLSYYNMAHWSVATEWQIYFLLPTLLLPAWKKLGIPGLVFLGIMLGLLPAFFPQVDLLHACFWYIGLFAIGGAGAVAATRMLAMSDKLPVRRVNQALAAAAFVFAVSYALSLKAYPTHAITSILSSYGANYICQDIRDTLTGCLSLCLILYCVPFMGKAHRSSKIVNILSSPTFVTLGAFSYSLYLTHCSILRLADLSNYFLHNSQTNALLLKSFIGVPLAVGFAYLFHLACERPFMQIRNRTR